MVQLSYRRWTLPEYTALFKELFDAKYLSLTNEQILQGLVEDISELIKPVYNLNQEKIELILPDVIASICAFSDKSHINLDEIMCNYIEQVATKIIPHNIIRNDYPETFEEWQLYLGYVYGEENNHISPSTIVLKIIEHVGKISRNLRIGPNITNVKKHLASILVWTITLANKFTLPLDDITYRKYPNVCSKCQKNPCNCVGLSTMFISYSQDTTNELVSVKELLRQLDLNSEAFDRLSPDLYRKNMSDVFNAIYKSDGAIILLKDQWSTKDKTELFEIFNMLDEKNVWIFVKKGSKTKINELKKMLREIKQLNKIQYYDNKTQLVKSLRTRIQVRIDELNEVTA